MATWVACSLGRSVRRLTWLRRMPGVTWLDVGEAPAESALPQLLALWEGSGGHPVPSSG